MPNIKSAKKRVKVNAVKALNNQMAKSELKTTPDRTTGSAAKTHIEKTSWKKP